MSQSIVHHQAPADPTILQITIDADVCKRCGTCAMACPVAIIQQESKGVIPTIVEADLKRCIRCGQCASVCLQGAILHSHFPEGTITPIRSELVPSYEQVLELMRSRRSKRLFKSKVVEQEVIEKVLEAARFAPSGHNEQSTEFIVIRDKDTIHQIGALVAKGLAKMAMPFRSALGRLMMRGFVGRRGVEYLSALAPEFEGLAKLYNEGTDLILHEPSILILFCADSVGGTFAGTNANLALHNAALAAESLGLGCFYPGFVIIASERDESIAKLVGLPETHKIYGALAMGYPRLKFRNWPERNPAEVTWVNEDGQCLN